MAPRLSGSIACTMPDFWPITNARRSPRSCTRIGGWPKSKSGPMASGQFVGMGEQPRLNASPFVSWRDQSSLPVLKSMARIASLVSVGGSE